MASRFVQSPWAAESSSALAHEAPFAIEREAALTNTGSQVHTASAAPGVGAIAPGVIFDTGGFAPGQPASITFPTSGTFAVKGQQDLPMDGHEISPLVATRSPR